MKKVEFIWEPISEWGMSMKPYLDQVKRQAVIVMKKPKLHKPRIRISTYIPDQCSMCPGTVGPQNKSGICSKCSSTKVKRDMKLGPRPTCTECGVPILRTNTKGLCIVHKKNAIVRFAYSYCACGEKLSNRNISGVCKSCQAAAAGPRDNCAVCQKRLYPTNKTGLCEKHGRSARQMAYKARRMAA